MRYSAKRWSIQLIGGVPHPKITLALILFGDEKPKVGNGVWPLATIALTTTTDPKSTPMREYHLKFHGIDATYDGKQMRLVNGKHQTQAIQDQKYSQGYSTHTVSDSKYSLASQWCVNQNMKQLEASCGARIFPRDLVLPVPCDKRVRLVDVSEFLQLPVKAIGVDIDTCMSHNREYTHAATIWGEDIYMTILPQGTTIHNTIVCTRGPSDWDSKALQLENCTVKTSKAPTCFKAWSVSAPSNGGCRCDYTHVGNLCYDLYDTLSALFVHELCETERQVVIDDCIRDANYQRTGKQWDQNQMKTILNTLAIRNAKTTSEGIGYYDVVKAARWVLERAGICLERSGLTLKVRPNYHPSQNGAVFGTRGRKDVDPKAKKDKSVKAEKAKKKQRDTNNRIAVSAKNPHMPLPTVDAPVDLTKILFEGEAYEGEWSRSMQFEEKPGMHCYEDQHGPYWIVNPKDGACFGSVGKFFGCDWPEQASWGQWTESLRDAGIPTLQSNSKSVPNKTCILWSVRSKYMSGKHVLWGHVALIYRPQQPLPSQTLKVSKPLPSSIAREANVANIKKESALQRCNTLVRNYFIKDQFANNPETWEQFIKDHGGIQALRKIKTGEWYGKAIAAWNSSLLKQLTSQAPSHDFTKWWMIQFPQLQPENIAVTVNSTRTKYIDPLQKDLVMASRKAPKVLEHLQHDAGKAELLPTFDQLASDATLIYPPKDRKLLTTSYIEKRPFVLNKSSHKETPKAPRISMGCGSVRYDLGNCVGRNAIQAIQSSGAEVSDANVQHSTHPHAGHPMCRTLTDFSIVQAERLTMGSEHEIVSTLNVGSKYTKERDRNLALYAKPTPVPYIQDHERDVFVAWIDRINLNARVLPLNPLIRMGSRLEPDMDDFDLDLDDEEIDQEEDSADSVQFIPKTTDAPVVARRKPASEMSFEDSSSSEEQQLTEEALQNLRSAGPRFATLLGILQSANVDKEIVATTPPAPTSQPRVAEPPAPQARPTATAPRLPQPVSQSNPFLGSDSESSQSSGATTPRAAPTTTPAPALHPTNPFRSPDTTIIASAPILAPATPSPTPAATTTTPATAPTAAVPTPPTIAPAPTHVAPVAPTTPAPATTGATATPARPPATLRPEPAPVAAPPAPRPAPPKAAAPAPAPARHVEPLLLSPPTDYVPEPINFPRRQPNIPVNRANIRPRIPEQPHKWKWIAMAARIFQTGIMARGMIPDNLALELDALVAPELLVEERNLEAEIRNIVQGPNNNIAYNRIVSWTMSLRAVWQNLNRAQRESFIDSLREWVDFCYKCGKAHDGIVEPLQAGSIRHELEELAKKNRWCFLGPVVSQMHIRPIFGSKDDTYNTTWYSNNGRDDYNYEYCYHTSIEWKEERTIDADGPEYDVFLSTLRAEYLNICLKNGREMKEEEIDMWVTETVTARQKEGIVVTRKVPQNIWMSHGPSFLFNTTLEETIEHISVAGARGAQLEVPNIHGGVYTQNHQFNVKRGTRIPKTDHSAWCWNSQQADNHWTTDPFSHMPDDLNGEPHVWLEFWTNTWNAPNAKKFVKMFDSHYYIREKDIKWFSSFSDVTIVAAGLNFDPRPGVYQLPECEGMYKIIPGVAVGDEVSIQMTTSTNAITYKHPLSFWKNYSGCIDLGWLQWFWSAGPPESVSLGRVKGLLDVSPGASHQDSYFKSVNRDSDKMLAAISALSTNHTWSSTPKPFSHATFLGYIIARRALNLEESTIYDQLLSTYRPSQVYGADVLVLGPNIISNWGLAAPRRNFLTGLFGKGQKSITVKLSQYMKTILTLDHSTKQVVRTPVVVPSLNMSDAVGDGLHRKWKKFTSLKWFAKEINSEELYQSQLFFGSRVLNTYVEPHAIMHTKQEEIQAILLSEKQDNQPKIKLEKAKVTKEASHQAYFYTAPLNLDEVRPNHSLPCRGGPKLIVSDEDEPQRRAAVFANTRSLELITKYLKDWQFEYRPKVRYARITRHGPQFITQDGMLREFEWDSKSVENLISGIFKRQLKTKLQPDPEVLKDFLKFSMKYIDDMIDKICLTPIDPSGDVDSWLESKQADFGKAKIAFYGSGYIKQASRTTFKPSDWEIGFSGFIKSGEVDRANIDENHKGYLFDQSSRPRLIFGQSQELASPPLNRLMGKIFEEIKSVEPGFIQGMDPEAFSNTLQRKVYELENPVSVSTDGSNFDGHQHYDLLDIDNHFWFRYYPRMLEHFKSNPRDYPNPEVYAQGILHMVTRKSTKLFLQFNGEKDRPLKISDYFTSEDKQRYSIVKRFFPNLKGPDWIFLEIFGTTFSGHPTRTTLGNTLRSLCYHKYMMHKANISPQEYYIAAAGDDVVAWIPSNRVEHYLHSIQKYTSTDTEEAKKGIGQCIKEWKVSDWWDIDFCSKHCEYSDQWAVYRDARKCWMEKMFYSGSVEQFHQEPERHLISMAIGQKIEIGCEALEQFYNERILRVRDTLAQHDKRVAHINNSLKMLRESSAQLLEKHLAEAEQHQTDHCQAISDFLAWKSTTRRFAWTAAAKKKVCSPKMTEQFLRGTQWSLDAILQFSGGSSFIYI